MIAIVVRHSCRCHDRHHCRYTYRHIRRRRNHYRCRFVVSLKIGCTTVTTGNYFNPFTTLYSTKYANWCFSRAQLGKVLLYFSFNYFIMNTWYSISSLLYFGSTLPSISFSHDRTFRWRDSSIPVTKSVVDRVVGISLSTVSPFLLIVIVMAFALSSALHGFYFMTPEPSAGGKVCRRRRNRRRQTYFVVIVMTSNSNIVIVVVIMVAIVVGIVAVAVIVLVLVFFFCSNFGLAMVPFYGARTLRRREGLSPATKTTLTISLM